ncbi:oxidoreductase [Mumia sp. zg.B53]|uniref:globin domain-containing protein n=1 Tax=unclassified Mumia TaxID=2621872 RepID=UPI001C6EBD02|nr:MULTISPECIES: globin domain-containing protein [unclassified Mumia]MBW9205855.1 oxidoreductase [Mumia sp. zg.B17]MBW9208141.1 oxidoreductase [Mumia sp. zg.B21]MBW9216096.1 oxidoreductase [Mumia sp. zg.B53]MDD9348840.1 FAD-binding oxidoreductase [Mumia sp.]
MDPAALKESWAYVAKHGDDVPLFFYSHLFLSHPDVRSMFPVSMSAQRDKLVTALGTVVSNVDSLENVVPVLGQLGSDHRRFRVSPDQYNAVGGSLLATLKHFLGEQWTDELAADWAAAYGVIAKTMVQGAEESAKTTPSWWDAEVVDVERRTLDVAVVRLRLDQRLPYRPGQSIAVEVPQRPRLWRYYSPANAPRDDSSIDLHVQIVDGGQVSSAIVKDLQRGDTVRMSAAVGVALTLEDPTRDLLLVAGGTGLAPMKAVIEEVDAYWRQTGRGPKVHLFHGARMPWNLYDDEAMREMTKRPWFSYDAAVSDDTTYRGQRGTVGHVAAARGGWRGYRAFVCGSRGMVENTVPQLVSAGIPPSDIRYEDFGEGGYRPRDTAKDG